MKALLLDVDGVLLTGPFYHHQELGISREVLVNGFFLGPFTECVVGKADLKNETLFDILSL